MIADCTNDRLGLALGASLPITGRAHAQGDQARFSSSAFDAPAALATGTQDATGVAASSVRVYSCFGLEVISSAVPVSTISPRLITAIRSLR